MKVKREALDALRVAEQEAADNWHPLDGVPAPDYVPERWNGPHVMLRMIRALEVLNLVTRNPGPGGAKSTWNFPIKYTRKEVEAMEWAEALGAIRGENDRSKTLIKAKSDITARMIKQMDDALSWPALYVKNDAVRAALIVWCSAKAQKKDYKLICRRRGWAYSTTRRRRDNAADMIADTLNAAAVEVF